MDDDKRELLRQLFATTTEFVESAHDAATRGQSGHLAAREYADLAGQLQTVAGNITALAEAAVVIAERSTE